MIGPGFSWTKLTPSAVRRRWLLGAASVCAVLVAIFGARFIVGPTAGLGCAVIVAMAAAVTTLRGLRQTASAMEVSIDGDGYIWHRSDGDASADAVGSRLIPAIVSRHLVTFTGQAGTIAIWHDNLPADRFRRLCSHARWHVERSRQGAGPEHDAQSPPA
jgi:hypothetical protein